MEKELDKELRAAFERVYKNSWYIEGKEDEVFEKAFADFCTVKYCVGCGNGLVYRLKNNYTFYIRV